MKTYIFTLLLALAGPASLSQTKPNPAGAVCKKIIPKSMKIGGARLVLTQKYRVTANNFLADGGDQFYEFKRGTERVGGEQDLDALKAFLEKHPSFSPDSLDRISVRKRMPRE
jgi:5'-nucleotidase